jgi:hypothetical protein
MVMVVGEAMDDDLEDKVQLELPKHHRCTAHALNLMATTDVSKVSFLNQSFRFKTEP